MIPPDLSAFLRVWQQRSRRSWKGRVQMSTRESSSSSRLPRCPADRATPAALGRAGLPGLAPITHQRPSADFCQKSVQKSCRFAVDSSQQDPGGHSLRPDASALLSSVLSCRQPHWATLLGRRSVSPGGTRGYTDSEKFVRGTDFVILRRGRRIWLPMGACSPSQPRSFTPLRSVQDDKRARESIRIRIRNQQENGGCGPSSVASQPPQKPPTMFLFMQQSRTKNRPALRFSLLSSVQGLTAISGGGATQFFVQIPATRRVIGGDI
jgi:hypothetical protein